MEYEKLTRWTGPVKASSQNKQTNKQTKKTHKKATNLFIVSYY